MRIHFFLAVVVSLVCSWAAPALAQTVPLGTVTSQSDAADIDVSTPEAIREMVSRMSDAEVRAVLLERLDAVARENQAANDQSQGSVVDFLQDAGIGVFEAVWTAVLRLPILVSSQTESFGNFYNTLGGAQGVAVFVGTFLIALAAAFAVERLVNYLTRNWHSGVVEPGEDATLGESLRFLVIRLLKQLYGLAAFFVVSAIFVRNMIPQEQLIFAREIAFNMIVLPRLALALGRFMLAPHSPHLRMLNTDNWSAKFLYRHQMGVILLMGFGVTIVTFNAMNGVPMGQSRLGFWLNLAVHIYLVWMTWRAWDGLVMMQRGPGDVSPFDERVARAYPWFLIVVVVLTWVLVNIIASFGMFELLQTAPHYKTMFLLAFAPTFDMVIRALVKHLVPPMTGEGYVAERAYHATKASYIRIGRVIVFALVVIIIGQFWGLDPRTIAEAGVGAQVAARLIEILIVLAAGYLVWELVSLWINRKLAAEQTALGFDLTDEEPGGGEGGGLGGSRLSTVLPLVLGIAKFGIGTIFGLIALSNIGIDVTPLLAGAGIIGLAVGFGAQKLVADIVSGIFFLIDDAFRTGEYVEVDGTMGTVENISIRSMQLRHHRGPVHTIPYGEIPKLTNYSRDWVIMKLKFTVPFDTDPNQVKKIFKKIGNEMIAEEAWKDDFLAPFKSQGVFDFDDVGMVMRGKFMAKPGKQFMARKEIYNRVKAAFDAAGIEFARREVRVAIPGLDEADDLNDEQKAAISGAAGQVAQQVQQEADQAGSKK